MCTLYSIFRTKVNLIQGESLTESAIVKEDQNSVSPLNEHIQGFLDLVELLVQSSHHHLNAIANIRLSHDESVIRDIHSVFAGSYLSTTVPLSILVLHMLLNELEDKKLPMSVFLQIASAFESTSKSFSSSYRRLTSRDGSLERVPSLAEPPSPSRQATGGLLRALSSQTATPPRLDNDSRGPNCWLKDNDLMIVISSTLSSPETVFATVTYDASVGPSETGNYTITVILSQLYYQKKIIIFDCKHAATGNYFEVEILESDCMDIAIGFMEGSHCGSIVNLMPGQAKKSYGYRGDDGVVQYDGEMDDARESWSTWTQVCSFFDLHPF